MEKVHVEGLARTKDDIIQDAVRDLFSAKDFQDVLVKAHKVSSITHGLVLINRQISGAPQVGLVGVL